MPIVYASTDDGTLYPATAVDTPVDPERYTAYYVASEVTLTADELCGADGRIVELLMRAGKIRERT